MVLILSLLYLRTRDEIQRRVSVADMIATNFVQCFELKRRDNNLSRSSVILEVSACNPLVLPILQYAAPNLEIAWDDLQLFSINFLGICHSRVVILWLYPVMTKSFRSWLHLYTKKQDTFKIALKKGAGYPAQDVIMGFKRINELIDYAGLCSSFPPLILKVSYD